MKQKSFSKFKSPIDLPDLLQLQKSSFDDFLQNGLHQPFLDVFGDKEKGEGLTNSDGSLILQYISYHVGSPKNTPQEARIKGQTFEAPLKATFRLQQKLPSGKIKELSEQEVFLCNLPLMTISGDFIFNGAERVIITQIHRSPGVVFEEDEEKKVSQLGKRLYKASIIPYRGAWIDFEFDLNNALFVHIDKKRKIPATVFLRAIGFESNEDIVKLLYSTEVIRKGDFDKSAVGRIIAEDVIDLKTGEIIREALQEIRAEHIPALKEKADKICVIKFDQKLNDLAILLTLKIDPTKSKKEAIDIIYKVLRTYEFITPEIEEVYLQNLLFKIRRYDLTRVGRYRINKKLGKLLNDLEKNPKYSEFKFSLPSDRKRVLAREDVVATIKYLLALNNDIDGYGTDDIDHLGNRRVRAVGEMLENQIRIGLMGVARFTRERMNATHNQLKITSRALINSTPLVMIIRRFFGTSQLSQFMDQTNPLAELTHKRRISALGPGGLHRKRAGFEVRDVHYTHYGRICPIETPEGPNIGLITSMACYSKVNEYGLIETPYRKVEHGKVTDKVEYLTADKEDEYIIAQADTNVDESGKITDNPVTCMHRGDLKLVEPKKVDNIGVSPMQMVSVSTALIPFLEHDDANRALMGSNMQRQALPLLITEQPFVCTGIEKKAAVDSFAVVCAKRSGEVIYVSSSEIAVYTDDEDVDIHTLRKYGHSNQNTCINYIPIVKKGQKVRKNEVIADGPCTSFGELALGRNLTVAFMSFEGYNFEDAIVISEQLVRDDVFTSIHIQEFQAEARDTKLGPEEITRDIPNVGGDDLLNLDETGTIRIGAEVGPGDILVGKTSPKGEQQVTMEERLLRAIFGKKAEDVIDTSLRVPPGVKGKIINVQVFTRFEKLTKKVEKDHMDKIKDEYRTKLKNFRIRRDELLDDIKSEDTKNKITKFFQKKEEELELEKTKKQEQLKRQDELPLSVNKIVKVFVATKRRIQAGDKIAGRHGNKGVVSKILPVENMPYLPDGTPIDVIISPLAVPSRMNVGQLLEAMLGWAASVLEEQMCCPVFDGANEQEVIECVRRAKEYLRDEGVPERYLPTDDCRITLHDGKTGLPFEEKVTVGNMYIMKLAHLVEDKIHARSTGPYSLITRQPLGGKAQFGGQRFGEMEVWAVEGYGASNTLQEFLTIKSDDVIGRTKVYESLIKGETLSQPGTPESFKVLVKELQAIGLNIELLKTVKEEPKKEITDLHKKPKKETAMVK